jgi:DNA-binding transcriptional regulator YiaG
MTHPNLADQTLAVRKMIVTGEAQRRRIAAGLSLETSAHSIGVCTASVYRWERQERQPQGRNAVAYYEFLTRLSALDNPTDDTTVPL